MNFIKLLRALIFIALFILCTNLIYASNILLNKVANNCIWLKYDSIKDSTTADTLIKFIIDNKINKVFLETYRNGEILHKENERIFESSNGYFNDIYISGNDTTSMRGYNPLQGDTVFSIIFNPTSSFMAKIDSLNNIQVYAWMDMYRLWSKNFYPDNQNHFYYKCPECLESDINGKSDNLIKLDKIQSLEWEGIFLSPTHPKVNEYLLNIFKKIMNLYVYNGIIIDYLRYQNYYYGYNIVGLEIFENEYDFNPLDLNRGIISKRFGYTSSEIDSLNLIWDNYRRDAITDLLNNFKNEIINDSLDFEILASVNISPFNSVNKWYQDWPRWISEELVDYIVVKNNSSDFYDFNYNNSIIKKMYSELEYINKIIIGINLYEINPVNIGNKILYLRLNDFHNISLYPYNEYKNVVNWYAPIYKAINFNLEND